MVSLELEVQLVQQEDKVLKVVHQQVQLDPKVIKVLLELQVQQVQVVQQVQQELKELQV